MEPKPVQMEIAEACRNPSLLELRSPDRQLDQFVNLVRTDRIEMSTDIRVAKNDGCSEIEGQRIGEIADGPNAG